MQMLITPQVQEDTSISDFPSSPATFDHFQEAMGDFDLDSFTQEENLGYGYNAQLPVDENPTNDFNPDFDLDLESEFNFMIDQAVLTPPTSIQSPFTDDQDPMTPESEYASPHLASIEVGISALGMNSSGSMFFHMPPQSFGMSDSQSGLNYDQRWEDPADDEIVVNMIPSIPIPVFPDFPPSPIYSPPLYPSTPPSPSPSDSTYSPQAAQSPSAGSPVRTPVGPIRRRNRVSKPSNAAKTYKCDFLNCDTSCRRPCDLTKHKKRHSKPFTCNYDGCNSKGFSTQKDRERHETSKHRREDHLVCCECGHTTARKDNMADHVRRKHQLLDIGVAMGEITAKAKLRHASRQGS